MSERTVHCEDALEWLNARESLAGASLVASLPDISEFHSTTLAEWKLWFERTAALVLSRTDPRGVAVFYQSDIKHEGEWVDKAYLCQKAAESLGHKLLWHKVACRSAPGIPTYARPAYSHIVCFSKELRLTNEMMPAVDVLPTVGEKTWERGMGIEACLTIARFVKEHTPSRTLVNPFCGEGAMLAAANAVGLNAIGIERSAKRAALARKTEIDLKTRSWVSDTHDLGANAET